MLVLVLLLLLVIVLVIVLDQDHSDSHENDDEHHFIERESTILKPQASPLKPALVRWLGFGLWSGDQDGHGTSDCNSKTDPEHHGN